MPELLTLEGNPGREYMPSHLQIVETRFEPAEFLAAARCFNPYIRFGLLPAPSDSPNHLANLGNWLAQLAANKYSEPVIVRGRMDVLAGVLRASRFPVTDGRPLETHFVRTTRELFAQRASKTPPDAVIAPLRYGALRLFPRIQP